jgi:hypothetical protein
LSAGYDIYHNSIPRASAGFRDYPTTVTLGNYTHDFKSAILCEGEDSDLTPEETLMEVTQCFQERQVILEYGFTPDCTDHELADLDWYYYYWYEILFSGMCLYGFMLILIAAHDISILCKRKAINGCSCKEEESMDVTCHCKRFRQWVQFFLFIIICLFVVLISIACALFTEHSAISSSFISRFDLGNRDGTQQVLPCNCGCVLQTPTRQGWAFWFSMHLFMWFMLLHLNRIKISYKMGPRMLTMFAPVPVELGEYGVDESTFWRRALVKERDPIIYEGGRKKGKEAYPQIEVKATNQKETIDCGDCCPIRLLGRCCSMDDWTLTAVSYRMYYTLLVLVAWIVLFDGFSFFFQILLRSYPENSAYEWSRAFLHMFMAIASGFIGCFTLVSLRMIDSTHFTSTLFSGAILQGVFHFNAHFAGVLVSKYFQKVWGVLWIVVWFVIGVLGFCIWMSCLCCWDWFLKKFIPPKLLNYTLKLFERDSMGQNLQYFLTLGGPRYYYPKCCITFMDFNLAPQQFQCADGNRHDSGCGGNLTPAATPATDDSPYLSV